MSLLASLLVLIVVARLFGRLFARYNQPELIGEILAGILLGPALLNLIQPNTALAGVTELAVFLIILNAGLEMKFSDIFDAMKGRGMILAALSFMIPFIGGVLVSAAYQQDLMRMIFLGLCISITALPVAVKLCRSVAPAALSVKELLAVVLSTITVPALAATLADCTAKFCSVVLPAVVKLNKPPTVLALTAKALASFM